STSFDAEKAAAIELEWWIVHRERAKHEHEDLEYWLAKLQETLYKQDASRFLEHAKLRADAMLLRDARAEAGDVSEEDWQRIDRMLDRSWTSLKAAVRKGP